MPELIPHAPDNPEFARVIELRQIRDLDAFAFDIAPTEAEARALVSSGMAALGYRYVNLDGGWDLPVRDARGNLQPDPRRFPRGIAPLAAFVHSLGLKFGIYQAPREETCAQYFNALGGATGALGHEQQDATTFASWGVDFLKYDWCSPWGTLQDQIAGFTTMRDALRATGRPPYYVLDGDEVQAFKQRFGAANLAGRLDWSPLATLHGTIAVYDPFDHRADPPLAIAGSRGGRGLCDPPQSWPPVLRMK